MLKILFVYAVNEEQITLDLPNYEFRYVQTGIGKVKAAIHLLDAIYTERPDIVLNIGTAGTLRHRVGDIFVCRQFIDRDFQKVQLPGLDYKQDSSELLNKFGLFCDWQPSSICNTGDSFLTEVSDIEGDVFDMEAYALSLVCKEKEIPFLSVKYVTDVIGENSVKHWEDKLAEARKGLKEFIEQHLM